MAMCPFCKTKKLNKRKNAKTCGDPICIIKNQKEGSKENSKKRSRIYHEWKKNQSRK